MRVARPTRADWRDVPPLPADGLIRSLRCCGSRPSGPSPEPLGKDEITCAMASGLIENGSEGMGFKAGKLKSEGMGGCFDFRASRVSILYSVITSSLQANLTAPL